MTSISDDPPSAPQSSHRTGRLSLAAHVGYAASLALHISLGTIALLIAVVTALNDNLASNERLDVNDTQLWLAVFLWVVALATIGVLWARRSPWGWLAPLIWALVGLPLAVTHAQVETIPPVSACATAGRITPGLTTTGPPSPPPIAWCHEADSPIHVVAAREETVYLASLDGTLTALDQASGETRWASEAGAATGAILARPGVVLGGGEATVSAWNPAGLALWTAATPGPVTSFAMNSADVVYVGCADGTILALDGATGAERWRMSTAITGPELALSGQDLFAFNAPREITIAVLDAASGEVRSAWIYDIGPQTFFTAPVLAGRSLVAGYEVRSDIAANTGGVLGMDPTTGAVRWDVQLNAPVEVAPAYTGGLAHVLAADGYLFRLDPQTGQGVQPPEMIESRGRVATGANRLLATNGAAIYISQRGGGISTDNIYSGVVTATDATGAAYWRFHLSEQPSLPVLLAGDDVFILDDRSLFAVLEPMPATAAGTPVQ